MKKIHVLGSGCAKCRQLYQVVTQAAGETAIPCEVEKVEDFMRFPDFGVMITPAVVVDGKVISSGRVPAIEEMRKLIEQS